MRESSSKFVSKHSQQLNQIQGGDKNFMKKSLSLILAIAMVFTMFASVAFAAELENAATTGSSNTTVTGTTYTPEQKFNMMKAAGIFSGDENGKANLDQMMTRAQFAKIIANVYGFEQDSEGSAAYNDLDGSTWAAGYIGAVTKAGLLNGMGNKKFNPTGEVTLEQLATVLSRAFKLDANTKTVTGKVSDWAKGYVSAAIEKGLIEAKADYTVSAKRTDLVVSAYVAYATVEKMKADAITAAAVKKAADEAAAAAAKAVGVKSATAVVNADSTATVTATIYNATTASVTVDALAAVSVTADTYGVVKYTTGALTVGDHTIMVSAVSGTSTSAATSVKVTVGATTVTSVTYTNLKEISVMYSASLGATAVDVTKYTLDGTALAAATATAAKQADGKTVIITLVTPLAQNSTHTLAISGVLDAAGNAVTAFPATSFTIIDTMVPTALSYVFTGPKTLDILFSEPVTSAAISSSSISINSNSIAATVALNPTTPRKVSVTLNAALATGVSHTFQINPAGVGTAAITDVAGFAVPTQNLMVTYVADTTLPTAVLTSASQNKVVFTFSKPMVNTGSITVNHTYNGNSAYEGTYAWTSNNTVLTVTFATNFIPAGSATLFLNTATTNQAQDAWGNLFASTSFVTTITNDLVLPTVTSIVQNSGTTIDVTFSKAMGASAAVASNYVLKDPSGTVVAATVALSTGNTYRLTTAALNTTGAYTLTIAGGNIKDNSVNANAVAAYTGTVTIADKVLPTVVTTAVANTTSNTVATKVKISFSEAMSVTGTGSILSSANYADSTGASLISTATFTAADDNKAVVITFPAATNVSAGFIVGRVQDAAGNATANISTIVNTVSGAILDSTSIGNAKAISTTSVTFDVNQPLSSLDVSKFTLDTVAAATASFVNKSVTIAGVIYNGATVTLTTPTAWATSAMPVIATTGATAMTTTLGTTVTTAVSKTAIDAMAPVVANATFVSATEINLTFSEALKGTTISGAGLNGFTVATGTLTSAIVGVNASVIKLTGTGFTTASTVSYNNVAGITDNAATPVALAAFTNKALALTGVASTYATVQGVTAVAATGTITYGTPTNGQTVTVDGQVFTKANDNIALNTFSTIAELTTLVNALANVNATASATVITVTAATTGTGGNALAIATTATGGSVSGATLAGGVTGVTEVSTLTITAPITNAGVITVTVSGAAAYSVNIAVTAGQTAAQVATAINAALAGNMGGFFTAVASTNTVVLTSASANTSVTDIVVAVN